MSNQKQVQLTAAVLRHYDRHKRELPWRDSGNPYYVWLSEIMLQQTRVEAVKQYFNRFIMALPDISALADCDEEHLLKLWEGLGYYSRARNLKKAAQQIIDQFQGQLPRTKQELLSLAGIGSYTAAAIASICFGQSEVALDGNLIRVFSRILMVAEDFSKQSAKKKLENMILDYLPLKRPGDFNQAIMDIGATICLPNGKPLCHKCPVAEWCMAHQSGMELSYPPKKEKKSRKIEKRTVLVIQQADRVYLQKRTHKGVLHGLWEFPSVPGHIDRQEAREQIQEYLPLNVEIAEIRAFLPANHIFSHLQWDMISYWAILKERSAVAETRQTYQVSQGSGRKPGQVGKSISGKTNQIWAGKKEINLQLSLPSAFKVYQQAVLNYL
ncbi:A/G-specific adenine glycosylase [Clostridiales bacterium COT073_COT-073]|nr:A/G-specific adenine glycosylase [Clostridiales bacterium COT073_COT-073]